MGFVWPPKPFCLASYLLFPWATKESWPFLYWLTLWTWCFLHLAQYVLFCFGAWTYITKVRHINVRLYHLSISIY
jgi:hypothetical protein